MLFTSCVQEETATELLQKTIHTIDTIETMYYKQDMLRTNPRDSKDTIVRYREMYFKRLIADSIVGAKGHWYMYINDKEQVVYEDIYDGKRLIRKNNRDSAARIYDLIKYPEFKRKHFWGHNTPYGMQYELKYILANSDVYSVVRLNDTTINTQSCFQIGIGLEDKVSLPGFASRLEVEKGGVSKTHYFIDKETFYLLRMKGVSYSDENPEQKMFIDQTYYDIKFNIEIDEARRFNTSDSSLDGFKKREMKPE